MERCECGVAFWRLIVDYPSGGCWWVVFDTEEEARAALADEIAQERRKVRKGARWSLYRVFVGSGPSDQMVSSGEVK